jgi:hypothetical protein
VGQRMRSQARRRLPRTSAAASGCVSIRDLLQSRLMFCPEPPLSRSLRYLIGLQPSSSPSLRVALVACFSEKSKARRLFSNERRTNKICVTHASKTSLALVPSSTRQR